MSLFLFFVVRAMERKYTPNPQSTPLSPCSKSRMKVVASNHVEKNSSTEMLPESSESHKTSGDEG